ncbi:hypothetical protein RIF29_14145 [Crotalaria pallida]|uniref:Fe2OG dioxygenase domain-containing protein n=1 Tax=Crotalaria pallida TaxID=3830 RepID=A0AAN9ICH4_CROPI
MASLHFLSLSLFFALCVLSVSSVHFPVLSNDNDITTHVPSSVAFDPTRVTQLSWGPRAFLYKGFLSEKECDHLINLARDSLQKSMVADDETGESKLSEVRTSTGMFLSKAQGLESQKSFTSAHYHIAYVYSASTAIKRWASSQCKRDEIVSDIEARIAAWTFLPIENGEPIQVLRYERGQKYEPHVDYFVDKINQKIAGHRMATVLLYLSNVEKGGETVFPFSESRLSQAKDESWSDCAKMGYAVKPGKGDALLFFSLHPNATSDILSLHGSCPVIEGEKWSATKWIHVGDFDNLFKQEPSGNCTDQNENCSKWAKIGECVKNKLYMRKKRNGGGSGHGVRGVLEWWWPVEMKTGNGGGHGGSGLEKTTTRWLI